MLCLSKNMRFNRNEYVVEWNFLQQNFFVWWIVMLQKPKVRLLTITHDTMPESMTYSYLLYLRIDAPSLQLYLKLVIFHPETEVLILTYTSFSSRKQEQVYVETYKAEP